MLNEDGKLHDLVTLKKKKIPLLTLWRMNYREADVQAEISIARKGNDGLDHVIEDVEGICFCR